MYTRIAASAAAISLVPLAYAGYLVSKSDKAIAAASKALLSEQANNTALRQQLNWQTNELLLMQERLETSQRELEDDRASLTLVVAITAIGVAGLGALASLR